MATLLVIDLFANRPVRRRTSPLPARRGGNPRRRGAGWTSLLPLRCGPVPPGHRRVEVRDLALRCLRRQPAGHFAGVATVVTKLFGLTLPHVAVFGQRLQQLAIIRPGPALDSASRSSAADRPEPDGRAMSSRNATVARERVQATVCSLTLRRRAHASTPASAAPTRLPPLASHRSPRRCRARLLQLRTPRPSRRRRVSDPRCWRWRSSSVAPVTTRRLPRASAVSLPLTPPSRRRVVDSGGSPRMASEAGPSGERPLTPRRRRTSSPAALSLTRGRPTDRPDPARASGACRPGDRTPRRGSCR